MVSAKQMRFLKNSKRLWEISPAVARWCKQDQWILESMKKSKDSTKCIKTLFIKEITENYPTMEK